MKRASLILLLVAVLLVLGSSVALAKPGNKMQWVCWTATDGTEQYGWYMTTGSGIVQQFKEDRHGVFKPADKFDMSGEDGWTRWPARAYRDCAEPTDASVGDYLVPGEIYWFKFNSH